MTETSTTLDQTRRALHAVAEHVLAAALHGATGRIGLRATPGGFGTPVFGGPDGSRQIRVDGVDLVVLDQGRERRAPLTTIRAAAEMIGVVPGAPADLYPPATPLDLDGPLVLDRGEAARLAALFAVVAEALDRFRAAHDDGTAGEAQLWPEHFDLAATLAEVNYGGSPGDDEHPEPYLYVGPWTPPTDGDPFWNEPFGASAAAPVELAVDTALYFFEAGAARLAR